MAMKVANGLDLMGQKIVNQGDPTGPQDSATKAYVDNIAAGLAWKAPVKAASTGNLTLSGPQTVDGVSLIAGDRALAKDQTTGSQNGIYVVAAGAWTRATDADSAAEVASATVYVAQGTANADKAFTQTADSVTLGTTSLVFAQVGGGTSYTADGSGIELSGTTFSLELDGATLSKSATGLKVNPSFAGNGIQINSDVASIKLDTNPGLTLSSSGLKLDPSLAARRFMISSTGSAWTGGAAKTITHGLGNQYVTCQVYVTSTGEQVLADIILTSTTALTVTVATGQIDGYYTVVVVG